MFYQLYSQASPFRLLHRPPMTSSLIITFLATAGGASLTELHCLGRAVRGGRQHPPPGQLLQRPTSLFLLPRLVVALALTGWTSTRTGAQLG